MFSSDVMMATRNGRPSVVVPTSRTVTRGEASSSFRK